MNQCERALAKKDVAKNNPSGCWNRERPEPTLVRFAK